MRERSTYMIEPAFVVRSSKEEAPGGGGGHSADVQRKGVEIENGDGNVEEGIRTENERQERRRGLELGNWVLT